MIRIAGPGRILIRRTQRRTDGMQATNKFAITAERIEDTRTHPRHDVHARYHVWRIRDLHPNLRDVRSDRAHAVGDHVHRAANHRTTVEAADLMLHALGSFPVV